MVGDTRDISYYLKCMGSGMLTCGVIQTTAQYRQARIMNRMINIPRNSITLSRTSLFVGYQFYGMGKFGFYQLFKDIYKGNVGSEVAEKYKYIGYSFASGTAVILACIFLSPFQNIKSKVQKSRPFPEFEYPNSLTGAYAKFIKKQGYSGLYKGLNKLWFKRVPVTVLNFVAFERFVQYFYDNKFPLPKQNYSKLTQLSISFASGFLAGVFTAIISNPADTMISKLYSQEKPIGSVRQRMIKIYKQIGFKYLWAGLGQRIVLIGAVNCLQWGFYDSFKLVMGLGTTGGGSKKP